MNKNLQKELVLKLREETNNYLYICKYALEKFNWDYEKAYDFTMKNRWIHTCSK